MASTKPSVDKVQPCSPPDAICRLPTGQQNGNQSEIQALHFLHWGMHIVEVKY